MSEVDTRFEPAEREAFITELRVELAAFIAGATTERTSASEDVSALLNLTPGDLQRVAATHVALHERVREFVAAVAGGALRSPITNSVRPVIVSHTIRGPIDWGRTVRARATSGQSTTTYAIAPAQRAFDTPENQALAWLIEELDTVFRSVPSLSADTEVGVGSASWMSEIRDMRGVLTSARRVYWLRNVEPKRPGAATLKRLAAARSVFYRFHVAGAIAVLYRFLHAPEPDDLIELIADRYFVPHRDWKLFEIVVALRLTRRLGEIADSRVDRLLTGVGQQPYARFRLGTWEVRLWYQSWPRDSGRSAHQTALHRYQVVADPTRPDVVVEVLGRDGYRLGILLEAKASRRASYLSQGVIQSLGYMKDRPVLFTEQPSAAVVAPPSNAFTPNADQADIDVAIVNSDSITDWVTDRVLGWVAS